MRRPLAALVVALLASSEAQVALSVDAGKLKYDPEQLLSKILGFNETSPRQAGYGLLPNQQLQQGVPFDPQTGYPQAGIPNPQNLLIQDAQNDQQKPTKKRRRRRRKPKLQNGVNSGYGIQYPGVPQRVPNYYGQQSGLAPQGFGQVYGPNPRPPRVRAEAEGALTAVTRALGSIAKYDDYQCVPRLLCEVASGRDASSSSGSVLPSFINMQPLITLLAAFNGITSSPLFVFGRAAILGMTSQGNSASCRYAYPQCPNDPDKLLDYLNNHNGGFFRFFSGAPDSQQNFGYVDQQVGQQYPGPQQGLQQFYNNLANIPLNQNYQHGVQSMYPINSNVDPQQNYGLSNQNQQYGLYNQGQSYGQNYKYENNVRFKNAEQDGANDNKIQKRIQNAASSTYVRGENGNTPQTDPIHNYNFIYKNYEILQNAPGPASSFTIGNSVKKSTWSFPESFMHQVETPTNIQTGKILKFPQNTEQTRTKIPTTKNRLAKGFVFPGSQSNRNYVEYYNYPPIISANIQDFPLKTGTGDLKFDASSQELINAGSFEGFDGQGDDETYYSNEDGEIVYVLRGDGDPDNPEVVRLRPGQNII